MAGRRPGLHPGKRLDGNRRAEECGRKAHRRTVKCRTTTLGPRSTQESAGDGYGAEGDEWEDGCGDPGRMARSTPGLSAHPRRRWGCFGCDTRVRRAGLGITRGERGGGTQQCGAENKQHKSASEECHHFEPYRHRAGQRWSPGGPASSGQPQWMTSVRYQPGVTAGATVNTASPGG
jgi:hypothetical protein